MKPSFLQRLKFLFTSDFRQLETEYFKVLNKRKEIPSALRLAVFKRDDYQCRYCGCKNRKTLTVDHFVPFCVERNHNIKNLVTACKDCNTSKASINPKNPQHAQNWNKFLSYANNKRNKNKITLINHRNNNTQPKQSSSKTKRKLTNHLEMVEKIRTIESNFSSGDVCIKQFAVSLRNVLLEYNFNKQLSFLRKTNTVLKLQYKDVYNVLNNQEGISNNDIRISIKYLDNLISSLL